MTDTEQEIIRKCIAGDRASQGSLYQLYARKMMGVCSWYAKNREEGEEILQDGFVRVFKYLHKYRNEGSLEGWIRTAMVSAALSRYRNKSALRPVVSFDADMHDVYESPVFMYQYDEKELVKLIQGLSPAYRLVFNLYVFEGLKHKEIATVLGISENTSKSNLADARRILQAALTNKNKSATI